MPEAIIIGRRRCLLLAGMQFSDVVALKALNLISLNYFVENWKLYWSAQIIKDAIAGAVRVDTSHGRPVWVSQISGAANRIVLVGGTMDRHFRMAVHD